MFNNIISLDPLRRTPVESNEDYFEARLDVHSAVVVLSNLERVTHTRGSSIHIHAECLPKARKELLRTEARYHINTRVLEGSYEYVGICK